jgi:hypothetical protein
MAKAALKKRKALFTSKLDLQLRKRLVKCCNLDTAESRSEIPGKF